LIAKIQAGETDEEILAILSELYPTEMSQHSMKN
jgi:hypothetical protein